MTSLLHPLLLLAQAPPPAAPAPPADGGVVQSVTSLTQSWQKVLLDSGFLLLVLFIFLTAIVTALFKQWRKDKCLKFLRGYHSSYITIAGSVTWGALKVYSKGLELTYLRPYRNAAGTMKTSSLLYESDLANCLALLRPLQGLSPREEQRRSRHIRRTFRPGLIRRLWRKVRNLFNTLRDAFAKVFTALLGQVAKLNPTSTVLTAHRSSVEQIGTTVIGGVANAYEPVLEAHIGKPVVIEIASPAAPDKKSIDIPGYLVDYTEKYVAVFSLDSVPDQIIDEMLTETRDYPGFGVVIDEDRLRLTCKGPAVLIVQSLTWPNHPPMQLDMVLTNGATAALPRLGPEPVQLKGVLTRHVDVVAARAHAIVRFGGAQQGADLSEALIELEPHRGAPRR